MNCKYMIPLVCSVVLLYSSLFASRDIAGLQDGMKTLYASLKYIAASDDGMVSHCIRTKNERKQFLNHINRLMWYDILLEKTIFEGDAEDANFEPDPLLANGAIESCMDKLTINEQWLKHEAQQMRTYPFITIRDFKTIARKKLK
jgi:hypothetical protein